ncbi:MAG: hypothetical protein K6E63_11380 [Lachnospiraceae bacterium]|nr:hypothetical protein [Lachnospiraceae bacterium]
MLKRSKILAVLLAAALAVPAMSGCNININYPGADDGRGDLIDEDEAYVEDEAEEEEAVEAEEEERADNELVLVGSSFTGLTSLKNENNDDGTYYYEDMTEDGMTVITNMCAPNSQRDGQDPDAYAMNFICALIDNDAKVSDPAENKELTEKFTYPVYTAEWETGENEDTKQAIGVVVLTDWYTYYYGLECPIDFYEDNEEFYKEELAGLQIMDFSEAEEVLEAEDEEGAVEESDELFDYYGLNIDELLSVFPDLEELTSEGQYASENREFMDKTEELDGRLLGPVFDVDADSNIIGISYSGSRFSLAGLTPGMPVVEAKKILKEDGWGFSLVDIAHGTAQYVISYEKDDMTLTISSTQDGNTTKMEENDVEGEIDTVSVYKN